MGDQVKPSAYIHERPTSSDKRFNYKHVTFFSDGKPGEIPLYTLENAAELLGIKFFITQWIKIMFTKTQFWLLIYILSVLVLVPLDLSGVIKLNSKIYYSLLVGLIVATIVSVILLLQK